MVKSQKKSFDFHLIDMDTSEVNEMINLVVKSLEVMSDYCYENAGSQENMIVKIQSMELTKITSIVRFLHSDNVKQKLKDIKNRSDKNKENLSLYARADLALKGVEAIETFLKRIKQRIEEAKRNPAIIVEQCCSELVQDEKANQNKKYSEAVISRAKNEMLNKIGIYFSSLDFISIVNSGDLDLRKIRDTLKADMTKLLQKYQTQEESGEFL